MIVDVTRYPYIRQRICPLITSDDNRILVLFRYGFTILAQSLCHPKKMSTSALRNVLVPQIDPCARWDIIIADGQVVSQTLALSSTTSSPNLLLPPLCHPHIHLDKPYLLTSNQSPSPSRPDYTDLLPKSGTFEEALANTSAAKARFTYDDLYLRGSQLLAESYGRGVTSMRVFVEVDHVVKLTTLKAAVGLKKDFQHLIKVQICAFAQDPLLSTEHGATNLQVMKEALETYAGEIEALGTTPYVEKDWDGVEKERIQHKNIEWAVGTAISYGLHLDFHLDYNIDASQKGMVDGVLKELKEQGWVESNDGKTVVIGHCTHLTTHTSDELDEIATTIKNDGSPVHFVGLPTSDLYMMGRTSSAKAGTRGDKPHERPRGTMQVLSMIKDYGLNACIGVNNVGNAFTPYGDGDPLQLACWGTGIYHAGTVADAQLLYECVSSRARRAIGLDPDHHHHQSNDQPCDSSSTLPRDAGHGILLPGLLIQNREGILLPGRNEGSALTVPSRQRLSIKDVVWDPPENALRQIVR